MLNNLSNDQKSNLAFIGSCIKGTAHNINTPLSVIMGRTEMLQMRFKRIYEMLEKQTDSEGIDKCLTDIKLIIENCNRVSDILKNLMQKCINVEGSEMQNINIATVLEEELEFLNADMDFKHNVEKSYKTDKNIPFIVGNYVHFSNSFIEIVENSKQAMINVQKKKFSVSVAAIDKYIEIKINDNGCGIEEEQKQCLLQVLNKTSPSDKYSGGLSRVAKLLDAYKAKFDIESMPGDTTFIIRLPV